VGYNVIIDAFKDGRADVLIAVVTPKHPSVSEIVSSVDVEFLGLDADIAKALLPLGYTAATMPPETFKNQSKPVGTVGFPTVLITNRDLPEPIAYTVAKTVLENKDALVRGHGGLAAFDPQTAWQPDKVGIPLHPGAERAYRLDPTQALLGFTAHDRHGRSGAGELDRHRLAEAGAAAGHHDDLARIRVRREHRPAGGGRGGERHGAAILA